MIANDVEIRRKDIVRITIINEDRQLVFARNERLTLQGFCVGKELRAKESGHFAEEDAMIY